MFPAWATVSYHGDTVKEEYGGGSRSTYNAKSKHAAGAVRHRLLRSLVILVGFQARVEHPADTRMCLKPLAQSLRVLAVASAAKR